MIFRELRLEPDLQEVCLLYYSWKSCKRSLVMKIIHLSALPVPLRCKMCKLAIYVWSKFLTFLETAQLIFHFISIFKKDKTNGGIRPQCKILQFHNECIEMSLFSLLFSLHRCSSSFSLSAHHVFCQHVYVLCHYTCSKVGSNVYILLVFIWPQILIKGGKGGRQM